MASGVRSLQTRKTAPTRKPYQTLSSSKRIASDAHISVAKSAAQSYMTANVPVFLLHDIIASRPPNKSSFSPTPRLFINLHPSLWSQSIQTSETPSLFWSANVMAKIPVISQHFGLGLGEQCWFIKQSKLTRAAMILLPCMLSLKK